MRKLLPIVFVLMILPLFVVTTAKADTATGTTFSVTKEATPETVGVSSSVSFSITIKNISASGASPLEVTDTLPNGFTFSNDAKLTDVDGEQSTFTPIVSGQTLTWTFDGETLQTIPADENIVISFTAESPSTTGSYTNQACLSLPESVCASVDVTVQTTPNTGIVENIAITSAVGGILVFAGIKARKRRLNFEESVLSSIK